MKKKNKPRWRVVYGNERIDGVAFVEAASRTEACDLVKAKHEGKGEVLVYYVTEDNGSPVAD